MKIKNPCIITSRLMPGIKIDDAWLSIEYGDYTRDDRMQYIIYLDTPQGEFVIDDVCSGVGGGSLQAGLESCLSFMGACAESWRYRGEDGENSDLFVPEVAAWCVRNADEIGMMQCILEETPNVIDEG